MAQWPQAGVPAHPRAWLVSVGRFKVIDALRRRARFDASLEVLAEPSEKGDAGVNTVNHPALKYEFMADDIGDLVKQLGFESVDVMGYSLGGGVALQTAIRHPDRVRKLVLVSTAFKRNGWYPEVLAGMSLMGPGPRSQ